MATETEANDGSMAVAADSGDRMRCGGGRDVATRPARADWQMPASDQRCPTCLDFWVPTAVCVYGEGWSLEWTCGDDEKECWGCATAPIDDLEWPFEDYEEPTSREELEALGFVVVIA